ncbi:polyamine oxidase 1 [Phoenix dactylifera]|uniref:Polyamine oxidase 1 n=1 Tax=Phoenix dactylifera TaxID=42345 RepID=A0A8B7BKI4_PHODC|nr:polyamine oxidase 1 [Phoenix dactylifera]
MVAKKPRIVIVGAGVAGLTAAHRLYTSSGDLFDLCVVEGGDRIGGRILTAEFAGDRVEMGATWIHGIGGSPIYAMAQDLQALTDPRPWERMDGFPADPLTVAEGGVVVDPARVVSPVTALYRHLMDSARAGDAPVDPKDPSVGSFLRRGLERYRASRGDAGGEGDWTLEALEDAVFAIHENTERTCTSADDLRGLDLAAEGEYRDFPGDQITIAKGYSRIVEALAAAIPPGAIRLGRRLRRIEWCPDGGGSGGPVRLHFEGDYTPMAADHVIVTVSLGVLKAGMGLGKEVGLGSPPGPGVVFSPALPDFKRGAIGRLGFGVVDKLFMEMDDDPERFFPFLQMAFDQASSSSARHVAKIPVWMRRTHSICPIYGGSRVLLAWFAGEEAMELESLGDEDIIRGAHATLDAFLPTVHRRIARVKRSCWARDPLFLGSYSYVAVGSSGGDLDLMAEPLPRETGGGDGAPPPLQILFAGEATHRTHYSTTHGAYFSGIREANRLLQHYRYTSSFVQ